MKENLADIKKRIKKTANACGRDPKGIRLVAVSKTIPASRVKEAIHAGIDILGENYIQEAHEKHHTLSKYPVSWHFIGRLQTNKAKYAVKLFDLIHTVDTLKLAREIDKQAKKIEKRQKVLVQVNVGDEASKSGIQAKNLQTLIKDISCLENLSVRGLMAMPPFFSDPEKARPFFLLLRKLRDQINNETIPNVSMDELSMGMSGDFEVAIEEGATLVRIGTAIFGKRH